MLYNMLSLWEKLSHQKTMAGLFKKSSVALSVENDDDDDGLWASPKYILYIEFLRVPFLK